MIQSAITVSLVEEAKGGPFVLWDGIPAACKTARDLGFDAIEIFASGPEAVDREELKSLLNQYQLNVAAVGTGAGMVKHKLSLIDADETVRRKAVEFIKSIIDFGAEFSAPAIIGSMQGRWGGEVSRDQALAWLTQALEDLGAYAESQGVVLIYEPLNRYETNLLTTIEAAVEFLKTLTTQNVKLLADLFHMNIEEANVAEALRLGAGYIGHVHFVDSNRQAVGLGHTDFEPIAHVLTDTEYSGYLSAEAFPLPDQMTAARKTIEGFQQLFG